MSQIWETVHTEREALISDLGNLSSSKWNTPSSCKGWTIHDVLAHLVDDAKTTKPGFILKLILAGFNFDRLNQRGVVRERRTNPEETLAAFRAASKRTTSAPAPLASRLVEIVVHGEDIRRPLGIAHEYPTEAVVQAIEYQLQTSQSMGGSKERSEGLKLIATDADWIHGTGEEVRGKGIDILIALTGRTVPESALTGEGAARIQ